MKSILSLSLSLLLKSAAQSDEEKVNRVPTATLLTNHKPIPLIGLGLGNVHPNDIPDTLTNSFGKTFLDYHLIDTAHSSENEELIASTISKNHPSDTSPHIVTKVWYTHLGYERTKLSVLESLANLSPLNHVHVLLHWPRCDDSIPWMECEKEEAELSNVVKNTGPSPLDDRPSAYLQSWRALEHLYTEHDEIVSIGVSNFSFEDWTELLMVCKIVPHVHQGNVWTLFNDPDLLALLDDNRVLFQAYGVMSQVVSRLSDYPEVEERLVAFTKETRGVEKVGTLLLAWFVQNRIGVVARSTDVERIEENAPFLVGMVPYFEEEDGKTIGILIRHLVNEGDTGGEEEKVGEEKVMVMFHNERKQKVHVYWVDENDGELIKVNELEAGAKDEVGSHPGHKFVVKDAGEGEEELNMFEVKAQYGQNEEFYVDL